MKIYINDEILDSKIENEENLGQVYRQIDEWLQSQGKYILRCLADGNEKTEKELSSIRLGSAERLDFYAGKTADILLSVLLEMDRYIDTVGNTIFGRDRLTPDEKKHLEEGILWCTEALGTADSMLSIDLSASRVSENGKPVKKILEDLKSAVKSLDSVSSIEKYLNDLRDLKIFVMNLVNKVSLLAVDKSTIAKVITAYSESMETLKEEFIRVNVNFQSGKDAVAGELLVHSMERLEILLNALISLKAKFHGSDWSVLDEPAEKLHSLMSAVAKSLESSDIVMAGDLLEYELPGVLDVFTPLLKNLAVRLSSG